MTRQTFTDNPNQKTVNEAYWQYKTNPIIHGYFPHYKTHKEQVISRVNKSLCILLAVSIMISFVSYYFVTYSEVKLNKLRKETLALNDDNIELQNKLDNLKSYYNVDKNMKQKKMLQKAQEIIEVSAVSKPVADVKTKADSNSAKWSLGY